MAVLQLCPWAVDVSRWQRIMKRPELQGLTGLRLLDIRQWTTSMANKLGGQANLAALESSSSRSNSRLGGHLVLKEQ